MHPKIQRAADLIREARHPIAFTGSGISAESGIPTYRGDGGVWKKYDPDKYASLSGFVRDPSHWWRFFRDLRASVLQTARPNQAHLALARLEAEGRLAAVITQNIDGLHQAAGSRRVIELHGNALRAFCVDCARAVTLDELLARLEREMPPRCAQCTGVLRPDVVFFGESLSPAVLDDATREVHASDLLIAVGSSLVVYPAASIPETAHAIGARLIIINLEPTPSDAVAELVFHGRAGSVLPQILARVF